MADISNIEPTEFYKADTVKWKRTDIAADYPATTWTLTYYFISVSDEFTVVAVADGSNFSIVIPNTTTDDYTEGDYYWTAKATNGSETHTIGSGQCVVKPDLAEKGAGYDGRTYAGITIAQAKEKLALWLEADTAVASGQSYMVSGRMLTMAQSQEIRNNINYWEMRVKNLSRGGIKVIGATPI